MVSGAACDSSLSDRKLSDRKRTIGHDWFKNFKGDHDVDRRASTTRRDRTEDLRNTIAIGVGAFASPRVRRHRTRVRRLLFGEDVDGRDDRSASSASSAEGLRRSCRPHMRDRDRGHQPMNGHVDESGRSLIPVAIAVASDAPLQSIEIWIDIARSRLASRTHSQDRLCVIDAVSGLNISFRGRGTSTS